MADLRSPDFDVLIVGSGILGVTIAYWLNALYDAEIALADTGAVAGLHTTSRNTGVIHRPFYLEPRRKRVFAQTSDASLPMWRSLAEEGGLPWKQIGTFNVALEEAEVRTLESYRSWGLENGMEEVELELLDGGVVRSLEPEVRCRAALLSKTDVSVDFGSFTRHLWRILLSRGVKFLGKQRVTAIKGGRSGVEASLQSDTGTRAVTCKFLVNAAGGGAMELAHGCGLGRQYTSLHFRGEYWVVDEPFASKVTSNIYRPPRFPQFPFLDPHFVVRADGSRQIGPNAVMVFGPYVYSGLGLGSVDAFLSRPMRPKARLMVNRDFLALLAGEWRSSLSKKAMCHRVEGFVPGLEPGMLRRRAVFGVRSSVIGPAGFVPEALTLRGDGTAHVINYNSPGASGAPAYSALFIRGLQEDGALDGLKRRASPDFIPGWDFDAPSLRTPKVASPVADSE
jgi:L-2-hydroxyglutarate oxidase